MFENAKCIWSFENIIIEIIPLKVILRIDLKSILFMYKRKKNKSIASK